MLKRLHVRNFTVFEDAEFNFSPGLNVLIGANGTGKSHVLKLGYAVEMGYINSFRPEMYSESYDAGVITAIGMASQLGRVFLAKGLNRLVRHSGDNTSVERSDISASFFQSDGEVSFLLNATTPNSLELQHLSPGVIKASYPVFIPAKEILTMMPDIVGLSDLYPNLLDGTYTNLARKLTIRLQTEPPAAAQPVIQALGEAMGGAIKAENGHFYLQPAEGEPYEIGLVAEGFRKLGTLAYLLGNGTLTKETTLYWDEPEANLNPALLRQLATLLVQLAAQGFQIILATHSLFLLKEFHILSQQNPAAQVRYFGLNERPGKGVEVTTTSDLEQLPDIAALDAELDLADRFQEVLDREDANDN